jgi:outer membrane protein
MVKGKVTMITLFLVVLWLAAPCLGADVAKIGVVNIQKVLLTSSAGKLAKAQINKKAREMESSLTVKKEEIEKSLVMNKETRGERERDIRIKINDIKSLKNKYENDLKKIEGKVVKKIQKDVDIIIQELGKKGGYLLIISNPVVLYSPSSIDITDQLIQAYNNVLAEKGGDFNIEALE